MSTSVFLSPVTDFKLKMSSTSKVLDFANNAATKCRKP